MKKLLLSLLAVACILPTMTISAASVKINSTNFPDKNFRKLVSNKFDGDNNGVLSDSEIEWATYLSAYDQNIESVEGIKYLKNLTNVDLSKNPLKELNVRYNTKITRLNVTQTPLKSITYLKELENLETLDCSQTLLYYQNLDNVPASRMVVYYDEKFYVPDGKFSLNFINSKWDKDRVSVKDGATKDGTQIKGFDAYGDVSLRYKRKSGDSVVIEFDYHRMDTPNVWDAKGKTYNSITLDWYDDYAVEYFEVYRATSKSGTYSKVKLTKQSEFLNTSVSTGKTYYYKVRGYHKVNGMKVYSKFSPIVNAKATLNQVVNFDRSYDDDAKQYKLTWDKVPGADGYQIYRSNRSDGTYKKVATTSSNYKKYNYNYNVKYYYYKVRAYRNVGSKVVTGKFSYQRLIFTY